MILKVFRSANPSEIFVVSEPSFVSLSVLTLAEKTS